MPIADQMLQLPQIKAEPADNRLGHGQVDRLVILVGRCAHENLMRLAGTPARAPLARHGQSYCTQSHTPPQDWGGSGSASRLGCVASRYHPARESWRPGSGPTYRNTAPLATPAIPPAGILGTPRKPRNPLRVRVNASKSHKQSLCTSFSPNPPVDDGTPLERAVTRVCMHREDLDEAAKRTV